MVEEKALNIFKDMANSAEDIQCSCDLQCKKYFIRTAKRQKIQIYYDYRDWYFSEIIVESPEGFYKMSTDKKFHKFVRRRLISKIGIIKFLFRRINAYYEELEVIKEYLQLNIL